nr:hypothetical protein [Acidobacteriota bacterium]
DFLGIVTALEVLMVAVITGLSVTRIGRLVALARELQRSGYDHRGVEAALELEERRLSEADAAASSTPGRAGAWLTAGAGVAATALGMWGMEADGNVVVVLGTALTIGAPLITVRRLWDRLGGGKLWAKLLRGRAGRALFRLGRVGLKDVPAPLPTAGERTEMALGRVAGELFRALPDAQRRALGDVPELVARLEADAAALRERGDTAGHEERLATAVAALETLRLDLLRLHAGSGTLDELTRNVEAARKVGEQIDAALRARQEVEDALREKTPER